MPYYAPQQSHMNGVGPHDYSNVGFDSIKINNFNIIYLNAIQLSRHGSTLPSIPPDTPSGMAAAAGATHPLSISTTSSGGPPRSQLLEDFRQSNGAQLQSLKELRDHVVEFAQDQHGSR